MSEPIPQLPETKRRLDLALEEKLIGLGVRFLYTINGSGTCHDGTLHEISPVGHVRLNDRGAWDWPPEVFVEEVLSVPAPQGAAGILPAAPSDSSGGTPEAPSPAAPSESSGKMPAAPSLFGRSSKRSR